MDKIKTIDSRWIVGIIIVLAMSRLIPHPPNFTPLSTMAILAGCLFCQLRMGLVIPFCAMFVSDLLIGLHSSMIYVYSALLIISLTCHWLVTTVSIRNLSISVVWATLVFFLITNFGAWISHDMYPTNWAGLGMAYIAGLPFLLNSLLGNIFFMLVTILTVRKISTLNENEAANSNPIS